jgi:ribosomal protein L32
MVMAGIPAVVAMQFPISDEAAILFSGTFYPLLAQGDPVDVAVAEGRRAIRLGNSSTMEWGTPVLFMRAPNGRLWADQPGTAVSVCPACGETVHRQSRFCSRCGAPLIPVEGPERSPVCPSCGKAVRPQSHFCPHCGAALVPSAAPQQGGVHIGGAARVAGAVAGRDAQVSVTGGSLYQEGTATPEVRDEAIGTSGKGQEGSLGE